MLLVVDDEPALPDFNIDLGVDSRPLIKSLCTSQPESLALAPPPQAVAAIRITASSGTINLAVLLTDPRIHIKSATLSQPMALVGLDKMLSLSPA